MNLFKICLLFIIIACVSCSHRIQNNYTNIIPEAQPKKFHSDIVENAKKMLGVKYKTGGDTPAGFDCSGLVQWSAQKSGIILPRTAREISNIGLKIEKSELEPGDIVAFRSKNQYHVGIYTGDGQFIHSSPKYHEVQIASLNNSYFKNKFIGGRKIISSH